RGTLVKQAGAEKAAYSVREIEVLQITDIASPLREESRKSYIPHAEVNADDGHGFLGSVFQALEENVEVEESSEKSFSSTPGYCKYI
ncbi:unnamed protein product, partial [Ceratitis capitata]